MNRMRLAGRALLTVYFAFLFLAASAVVIPVLSLGVVFSRMFSNHRATLWRFREGIRWYGWLVIHLPFPFIRVTFENRSGEHHAGIPLTGPFIYVCNHRSSSDPFLMGILPGVEAVQVVNIWPFRIPIIGKYARWAGYLDIRARDREDFFAKAQRLLSEGTSIIFFPEGTRSGGRAMGSFHGAAFRLFLESRVSILPLCISGNERIPPKGSFLFAPGRVRVRSLPPIRWEDWKDANPFVVKNAVRDRIQRELDLMEDVA